MTNKQDDLKRKVIEILAEYKYISNKNTEVFADKIIEIVFKKGQEDERKNKIEYGSIKDWEMGLNQGRLEREKEILEIIDEFKQDKCYHIPSDDCPLCYELRLKLAWIIKQIKEKRKNDFK